MSPKMCDLIVIGGGPAGLSAAVNAASEGLVTVICDSAFKLGGQAGTSSLLENFLGFPDGISGEELTKRAVAQAAKFNVQFMAPFNVISLKEGVDGWIVKNEDEESLIAKVVLIATGVVYKSLDAKNIARFIGLGVSYGFPSLSENYQGKVVTIVGGANSAGQAAVYLSQCPECTVRLIVRGGSINDKMSTYLVEKIQHLPNIKVYTNTDVVEANGKTELSSLTLRTGVGLEEVDTDRLFILIGARPRTHWLRDLVRLDPNGFILTGPQPGDVEVFTSMQTARGIFACGDVRHDSVKRVANAVGEGAKAVQEIHSYLSIMNQSEVIL